MNILPAKPQLSEPVMVLVYHEDIRCFYQPEEYRPAFLRLQIQGDAPFIPIGDVPLGVWLSSIEALHVPEAS